MKSLRYGLLAIGLSSQLGCAHAQQAGAQAPVNQESSMSASNDEQIHTLQEYPELTPEGMGRRFLSYLGKIYTQDHISIEFIEKQMGVDLTHASWGGNFVMQLPDSQRSYSLTFLDNKEFPSQKIVTLWFSADLGQERWSMTPLCAMDFNAYRAELEQVGYTDMKVSDYDHGARLPVYYYARGNVVVTIDVLGESEINPGHLCVRNIDVSVGS